jgi:hypothetical protein
VVILVIDQGESEGHDDDEEYRGADAESPAGTVVPQDGDPDVSCVEALIPLARPARNVTTRIGLAHPPSAWPALDHLTDLGGGTADSTSDSLPST